MPSGPFNNPFAKLAGARDALPAGPEVPPVVAAPPRGPACAVLRRERKGHAGKEVTRVEKLGLDGDALRSWCQALKRELGVGGQVDGGDLVFQGDQRERLAPMLQARGVREIIRG